MKSQRMPCSGKVSQTDARSPGGSACGSKPSELSIIRHRRRFPSVQTLRAIWGTRSLKSACWINSAIHSCAARWTRHSTSASTTGVKTSSAAEEVNRSWRQSIIRGSFRRYRVSRRALARADEAPRGFDT